MSRESTREILSVFVDAIIAGDDPQPDDLMPATKRTNLISLLEVVKRIRRLPLSAEPSPLFQEQLRAQLLAAAAARPTSTPVTEAGPFGFYSTHRRGIFFGAAALGSLASVAAFFVVNSKARQNQNSKTAA